MFVSPASVCLICVQCLWRPEEGITSSGVGVTDFSELPYGCLELNLGSLKE